MDLQKNCDDSKTFSFLHSGKRTLPQEMRFARWILVWAIYQLVFVTAFRNALVPELLVWPLTITSVLLSLIPGYMYIQFVKQADELIQKIQLLSMCMAFGITLLYLVTRLALARVGFESGTIKGTVLVMAISWSAAQVYCMRKYR